VLVQESGLNSIQLVVTVMSWLVGLLTAIHLQERQHRRQQLGLAQLLLAELDRIQMELGRDERALFELPTPGLRVATPGVHPWIQEIISQIAPTSPVLISQFMTIERLLSNLQILLNGRNEQQHSIHGFRETLERSKSHNDVLQLAARELELRKLETNLDQAEFRVKTGLENLDLFIRLARDNLAEIVSGLTGSYLRGLWVRTREKWRRGKRLKRLRAEFNRQVTRDNAGLGK